jgi:hypothetical protein
MGCCFTQSAYYMYVHIWEKLFIMKMKKIKSHLGVAINNVQILHFCS